jgi:hypothetical protein
MDRGWGARSTVDRWWRGPNAPERGGALTRAWPPAIPVHESSPAGGTTERGEHEELNSGLTGLGRRCGDRATTGKRRRRESSATVVLVLRKRGKSEMGEVR